MGEYADEAVAQSLDSYWDNDEEDSRSHLEMTRRFYGSHYQKGTGNHRWRIADGTVVEMADMSTEHIKNALRFCDAIGNTGKAEQFRYVLDQRRRQGVTKSQEVPKGTVTTNLFGLPFTAA